MKYGWLLPNSLPYIGEADRLRNEPYERWKSELENGYFSIREHVFGMSFDLESIIIPMYLERSYFQDFYKFIKATFKSDSGFEFRAADIRSFLDSRNHTSGLDIGSIVSINSHTSYFPMRLNIRRSLPQGIERIDIRATRISENIACISLMVSIKKDVGIHPNQTYLSDMVVPSYISKLGSKIGTSSVSHSNIDVDKRKEILKLIDEIHLQIIQSSLFKNSYLLIPNVKYLSRSRMEIYRANNNFDLIFNEERNFRRQSLFRSLGIEHIYYIHKSEVVFNFVNLDANSQSSSVILYRGSLRRDWDYDLLGCVVFIMCRQLFIEHISNQLFHLENSFSRFSSKQKILKNYSDIISNKKELLEILDFNQKGGDFLKRILQPLDLSMAHIYYKFKPTDSKQFLKSIDSLLEQNVKRIDRLLDFINETRNYENLKFNYSVQKSIQNLTKLSVFIALIATVITIFSK